jgi:hypothetical protein
MPDALAPVDLALALDNPAFRERLAGYDSSRMPDLVAAWNGLSSRDRDCLAVLYANADVRDRPTAWAYAAHVLRISEERVQERCDAAFADLNSRLARRRS